MREHFEFIRVFEEIWWFRKIIRQALDVTYLIKVIAVWIDSWIQKSLIGFWPCQKNCRSKLNRQL